MRGNRTLSITLVVRFDECQIDLKRINPFTLSRHDFVSGNCPHVNSVPVLPFNFSRNKENDFIVSICSLEFHVFVSKNFQPMIKTIMNQTIFQNIPCNWSVKKMSLSNIQEFAILDTLNGVTGSWLRIVRKRHDPVRQED